jgi:hypothetical protein
MSDGQLIVHVTGGIRNPNMEALPYQYTWYAKSLSGDLEVVGSDSILANIPAGQYRVVIDDYSRVTNTITLDYYLVQPDLLEAVATDTSVVCGETTPVTVSVTGGTPPYRYEWSTGDITPELTSVGAGRYLAFITDSRFCETTALARVSTPSELTISVTVQHPICYQTPSGNIQLQVSGGTPPYSYHWNTGATTKDLQGVEAGTYTVTVTDSDGCTLSDFFFLSDPEPLTIGLGEDRTLCTGQTLTIASEVVDPFTRFEWTGPGGFQSTDSTVTVSEEGVYRLTITDSKGCRASDEIRITVKDIDINSEIVVSTSVFVNDTVVVVNISDPTPERFEWLIDPAETLEVIETSGHLARIIFHETGQYTIGFRSYMEDCYADDIKTLSVVEADDKVENDQEQSIILKFNLLPNPNNGTFTVDVELSEVNPIRLRLIHIGSGRVISDKRQSGAAEYKIPYTLSVVPGIYALLLETASGNMNIKMIVY